MGFATYEDMALRWQPESNRDHIFNILAVLVLAGFLSIGIIASSITLPKHKREKRVHVPERVARYINERPKPKVKPVPKEIPKPLPPPIPLVRHRKKVPSKPLTKIEKKARKKAENSGLLALTKQLSGLMDTSNVNKMVNNKLHHSHNAEAEASVNSKILTSNTGKGSVAVNQDIHGGSGHGARLDNNQQRLARRLLASHGEIANPAIAHADTTTRGKQRGDNLRSEEDVAYIMDRHKSMLHSLYRRARRTHPGLKGKIVLEITILPSGKVSKVRVVSSELHDQALEQNLIARIRQFDFGARPVEVLTVTIPVEFLPS